MKPWDDCKNILCVRLDNMGDLLMSEPAIRALKETFGCKITLLTSSMAKAIAHSLPVIDEVLTYDAPWVKLTESTGSSFSQMINILEEKHFDAAVIFTVYSQNPLPAAMLAYFSGIPERLAYCRENPYHLLTHWVPEKEPYSLIRHQVRRDLDLVKTTGAITKDERICLPWNPERWISAKRKLQTAGIDIEKPFLILHPGVSEEKRQYPANLWIDTGKKIMEKLQHTVVITGSGNEKILAGKIADAIGHNAFSVAGLFNIEELITVIRHAALMISVNTVVIHIAAAMRTRVIVLYALTNPQHSPWKAAGSVMPYSVPESLQSKNEVIRFARNSYFKETIPLPCAEDIALAAYDLLNDVHPLPVPELIIKNH